MKRLFLLLTVLTLALGAQAGMMRMQGDYRHQFKNNKVAGAVLTQTQALELQAQRAGGPNRVITTRPEGDFHVQGQKWAVPHSFNSCNSHLEKIGGADAFRKIRIISCSKISCCSFSPILI